MYVLSRFYFVIEHRYEPEEIRIIKFLQAEDIHMLQMKEYLRDLENEQMKNTEITKLNSSATEHTHKNINK